MVSKHFNVHELVPKKMYEKYGEKAWRYVDARLIDTIDKLKEHFSEGTMTINNYYWGGDREWSGIRTPDSPYYNVGSQHSYGNAVDIVWSSYSVKEVRDYVLGNLGVFDKVRGIEIASWLHVDVRNSEELVIFDSHNKVYSIEDALKQQTGA